MLGWLGVIVSGGEPASDRPWMDTEASGGGSDYFVGERTALRKGLQTMDGGLSAFDDFRSHVQPEA
jgi:hypothetical protein